MKYPISEVKEFVAPFYADKDIMHDLTHIERILIKLNELADVSKMSFGEDLAEVALYFHGIIYSHEASIKTFLQELKLDDE